MKKYFIFITFLLILFFSYAFVRSKNPDNNIVAKNRIVSYLINNAKNDGTFTYLQTSRGQEDMSRNLYFRQLYGMLAVASALHANKSLELKKIHLRNIKSITNHLRYENNFAYIHNSAEENILTETNIALLTLATSPESGKYKKDIEKLANFILHQQGLNGYVLWTYPQKPESAYNQKDFTVQSFTAGQSILACAKAYELLKDEKYLTCARMAFTYYYPLLNKKFDPTLTAWLIIGTTGLSIVDTQNEYKKELHDLTMKLSSHVLDGQFFNQSKVLATNTSEIGLLVEALEKGMRHGSFSKSEYEKLKNIVTLGDRKSVV